MPVVEAHLADYAIVEILAAFGRSMYESRYPPYFSSDIRNLWKFMSALSLLTSLDCWIMHLARAVGTAVGAVFTTTDVAQWGADGADAFFLCRATASIPARRSSNSRRPSCLPSPQLRGK